MRKLWCLEVEKIGEKNIDGISQFFFLKTNGGNWRGLKRMGIRAFLSTKFEDQASLPTCGVRVPHGTRGLVGPCGTRPLHVDAYALAFGHLASPAHLSRSSAIFGHLNSDFESIFGLRIMTPSNTTMTMKLWQMVENSSRKTTTNTTQRMRTKSSVATSFGLET